MPFAILALIFNFYVHNMLHDFYVPIKYTVIILQDDAIWSMEIATLRPKQWTLRFQINITS